MNTLERLRMGLERVKRGWCHGLYAKDADGYGTWCDGNRAEQWCLKGAVNATFGSSAALDVLKSAGGIDRVAEWNDAPGRTQAEVIALFERAIAAEESKQ